MKSTVAKTRPFGCKDCEYISYNHAIAIHKGDHLHSTLHCVTCNELCTIDYRLPPRQSSENHKIHNTHHKECKYMNDRTLTCSVCDSVVPEYPRVENTYESVFGGEVELLLCMDCGRPPSTKIELTYGDIPLWKILVYTLGVLLNVLLLYVGVLPIILPIVCLIIFGLGIAGTCAEYNVIGSIRNEYAMSRR